VICGADTIMLVNGRPLCIKCDDEIDRRREAKSKGKPSSDGLRNPPTPPPTAGERSERRMLLTAKYDAAVLRYRSDVVELARAAGALELDAFKLLQARCKHSKQVCGDIRQQLITESSLRPEPSAASLNV
jgi:hypothetical protein